ncbi:MAG TPA: hypothetical protein VFO73_06605, partial [Candidatus Limnocylindrales bacterium]|nr:hypothetical protein [Candidatus Limnocylindrales bacterium]
LAQSLKGLGRIDEAIVWYDRRAAMTGTWEEERWHASYQAARLRGSVEDLLAVHAARPWRHEPLTAAAAIVHRRDPNANGDTLFRELFPTIPSVPKGDVEWDEWRANYDRWSFEEHRRFYRKVAGRYPIQRQWDGAAVRAFLADTLPRRVVEIGGWDGSLAAEMLREFDTIETWTNYEIADVPQACDDGRYRRVVLDDWPWLLDVEADALIASHVVEHMRVTEAEELLRRWDLGAAFIDTPVGKTARSWAGYRGSHIIEVGNGELVERLASTGYDPTVVEATDDRLVLHLRRQEPPSSV